MRAYPSYKHSGIEWIGEVPEHWIGKPLKYFSAIVLGIMFGTVEEWIGYVFYGIGVIITCVEIFRNHKKKSAVSKD